MTDIIDANDLPNDEEDTEELLDIDPEGENEEAEPVLPDPKFFQDNKGD